MASFFSKNDDKKTRQHVVEAPQYTIHAYDDVDLREVLTGNILAAMKADEHYQAIRAECVNMLEDEEMRTLAEINSDRRIQYRREPMDLLELSAVERSVDYVLSMAKDQETLSEAIHAMSAQRVKALFHAFGAEYFSRY